MEMVNKRKTKREMDMRSGTLWNKILLFALPIAASSILQQLFNSADMAIVGQFSGSNGENALAAVGSNGPFVNLLINLFVGLSVGANVVIARYLGEGDNEKVGKAVHTTVSVSLISGVFIMLLGIAITPWVLKLMSTPEEIFSLAVLYLRIYFLGMPFIMFYNFGAAILRSRGDTKRPFLCLLISGIINVILNLVFVIVFEMSVAGVGIATVISNIISAAFMLYFLTHEKGDLKLSFKKLKINKSILKDIAKIGVPAGVQGMVFSFSNICVQSAINSLGKTVVAASAAALNFEIFIYLTFNAFTQACVTFTSQNYGAGNYKRCTRVMWWCLGIGILVTAAMSFAFLYFGHTAMRFYTNSEAVIKIAVSRMKFAVTFMVVDYVLDVMSGAMRGVGCSLVPAIISALGVCGLRLVWVYTVFALSPTFNTLMMVYPVTWTATAIAMVIAYLFVRKHIFSKNGYKGNGP